VIIESRMRCTLGRTCWRAGRRAPTRHYRCPRRGPGRTGARSASSSCRARASEPSTLSDTPVRGRLPFSMTTASERRHLCDRLDDCELARIGTAEELQIASRGRDGSLSRARTIWVVPYGDDLYVRSVNGPAAAWFRGTQARHEGQIRAGGLDRDVAFEEADHGIDDQIDAAYRTKYHRYAKSITDAITSRTARSTTIRLMPRANGS